MAEQDKKAEEITGHEPEKRAGVEKKKGKSLFETARELEQAERRKQELAEREHQKQQAEADYKEREKYGEQLEADKRELIRLKQGIASDSDTIFEEKQEKRHYTLRQRIGNFFYHNKWWLGIAAFFAVVIGVLIYDDVTTVEPDMIILQLSADSELALRTEGTAQYFEQFVPDLNGDGQVKVAVYCIPVTNDPNNSTNYYNGDSSKLVVEMQSSSAMLVLADSACKDTIMPEQTFQDLSQQFSDNPLVSGYSFDLTKTDFLKKIGYEGELDDLYLGIRKVQKLMFATEEKMQASYDQAFPVLEQVISDLSK